MPEIDAIWNGCFLKFSRLSSIGLNLGVDYRYIPVFCHTQLFSISFFSPSFSIALLQLNCHYIFSIKVVAWYIASDSQDAIVLNRSFAPHHTE
jgi:hypothetical protein